MSDESGSIEQPPLRDAPLPSRSAMVRGLVGFVAVLMVALSVLGLAGRYGWLLDLCNHFRFQYLLILLATTTGLVLLRSWRLAGLSFVGLALNAALVLPLYLGSPAMAQAGGPTLTVMHFNVNTANRDHAAVVQAIHDSGADLLFVQEVNPTWVDALTTGLEGYTLVVAEPRTDNFGIACFKREGSEIAIESARAFDITGGEVMVPVIELQIAFDGRAVSVLSIHPLPPISVVYARSRNATLDAAGQWASEQDSPCVVVGDFNATPWSTALRDMQSVGGLVNSQVGFGRSPSWPAGLNSLGMIPIDHLLHSEALVTTERLLGDGCGSDHRPLIVDLTWAAAD